MRAAALTATALVALTFLPLRGAETDDVELSPGGVQADGMDWWLLDDGAPDADDVALDDGALSAAGAVLDDDADSDDDAVRPSSQVAPWTGRARITSFAPGCGDSGLTATGTRPAWGTVAVDPRVIRLYSRLQIEGFGDTTFTALDTGGGVHGEHIDVWLSTCSAARQFGVQTRAYRVLR